jgi:hypothetical protein
MNLPPGIPNDRTVIQPIWCEDEDCGMQSVYQCFGDGSYRAVLKACQHAKRLPSRRQILEAIAEQEKLANE